MFYKRDFGQNSVFLHNMKKEQVLHDVAFSNWAIEFVVLARQYCAKLDPSVEHEQEESSEVSEVSLSNWLYEFLGLLFYKASRIPNLQHFQGFETLGSSLPEMDYQRVLTYSETMLGEDGIIAFQLSEEEGRLYQGEPHLSEILADLYQELYELLIHYRDGEPERMVLALARCQYYFLTEWGTKLLLALRWLQMLRAEQYLEAEDV